MITISNCAVRFKRLCPMRWENLRPTADETVRLCETCWRQVFLCRTDTLPTNRRRYFSTICRTVMAAAPIGTTMLVPSGSHGPVLPGLPRHEVEREIHLSSRRRCRHRR
jgi:hypothetical protein